MIVKPHHAAFDAPLSLDCGAVLPGHTVAYETYGERNADASNAVLVFHGLIGIAHAAGRYDEADEFPGWWDGMIGPGKPLDTQHLFVVCANLLGSSGGSTGPASTNPATGRSYGLTFPEVTLADMVRAQKCLLDKLGISHPLCVIGPSTGAMLALQFAMLYPECARGVVLIAGTSALSAQSLAFNYAMRQAVINDPNYQDGDYYGKPKQPKRGLALAFSLGAIAWMTQHSLTSKFGRRVRSKAERLADPEFELEHFFHLRGRTFARIFDANAILYLTRAIDRFDPAGGGKLADALRGLCSRFLLVSYDTDWRYPTAESAVIADALREAGCGCEHIELKNPGGHASFLRHTDQLATVVTPFLESLRAEATGAK